MKRQDAITCEFAVPFRFRVYFTEGVFDSDNELLREVLQEGGDRGERVLAVFDEAVFAASPTLIDDIGHYLGQNNV
ncbi:MAG TPA: hypothetical protein VGQ40_00645, partial [Chthoniobacterales bacterium]|nr:hypothetical protein [Chthoniobacterales bacterium]